MAVARPRDFQNSPDERGLYTRVQSEYQRGVIAQALYSRQCFQNSAAAAAAVVAEAVHALPGPRRAEISKRNAQLRDESPESR